MRVMIRFCYDGSHFNGFQRQKGCVSVQKTIEDALTIINKKNVVIKGAGRTDVGVHALGQVAHFDLDIDIPEDRLMTAINRIVEPYIYVYECKKVSDDFHARFSAEYKKYIYKIWLGKYNPLIYDYYCFYNNELNVDKLNECAKVFVGKHNFHNFVSGERVSSNGEIFEIEIKKVNDSEIDIIFVGKSFYRYMVRNLVGAMLDYNEGKCELDLIKKMLSEDNYSYQLRTAEAKGLYLEGVYYE